MSTQESRTDLDCLRCALCVLSFIFMIRHWPRLTSLDSFPYLAGKILREKQSLVISLYLLPQFSDLYRWERGIADNSRSYCCNKSHKNSGGCVSILQFCDLRMQRKVAFVTQFFRLNIHFLFNICATLRVLIWFYAVLLISHRYLFV
ncbi:hypothetical protein ACOMICROBIO_LKFPLAJE_00445 [Vibrio sp. B1FIG11]|nr:hypothetical protein ACOMICROBIO_LKFPLAJE_00445 [Vibrio sp. B1FIG11]